MCFWPGTKKTQPAGDSVLTTLTVAADSAEQLLTRDARTALSQSGAAVLPTPSEARRVADRVCKSEPQRLRRGDPFARQAVAPETPVPHCAHQEWHDA